MADSSSEFVSYEPSKSVCFGHQAKIRNARSAWVFIENFLKVRTHAYLNDHISLRCVFPFSGPVGAFNEYRRYVDEALGTGECGKWVLTPADLEKALSLAFDEDRWPRQSEGPAWLSFGYSFDWKTPFAPNNGPLLATSSLHVIVSAQRIFLQPTLVFPWPWDSDEIRIFLRDIESDLPFQLRAQYFKRRLPAKNGGYRVLKIPKDWLHVQRSD